MPTRLAAIGCLLVIALAAPSARAQQFHWAKGMGGTGPDSARGVAVDAGGNVYTVGSFRGTVDFDPGPGTFNLTASGALNSDVFISKLDSAGSFVWAKGMGGTGGDSALGVAVDAGGNVYTVGQFFGTVDFDPGPGTFNLTASGAFNSDVFISKLDSAGSFVWAKHIGGTSGASAAGVAVDASGNVHTVGAFGGTADFDPGPGTFNLTSTSLQDVFVSKLNSAGNLVWAKSMGGGNDDFARGVAVDASGNVYTVGSFPFTADFDPGPGTLNLTSAGGDDVFISKLDSAGNLVWAKRMGGMAHDIGYAVTVNAGGQVYTAGSFAGTADFDPGPGTLNLTSAGGDDVFMSKLDGAGNLVWANRMGGTSSDKASGVALDGSGNVYAVGFFSDTVDFDPGPGTFNLTSAGIGDAFVSMLDSAGTLIRAAAMGGTSDDTAAGVVLGTGGNAYSVGSFAGTADFDPGPGTSNLTSAGMTDAFVSKLSFSSGAVPDGDLVPGAPLRVDKAAGTELVLDWDPSCSPEDVDYAVYEGVLGQFTSHRPVLCSTGGATSATIDGSLGKLDWAKGMGGGSTDAATGVALDGSGNVYTVGSFAGTADFDPGPGTLNLTSAGDYDVFISKLSSAGNLVWAKGLGGPGGDQAFEVAVDASMNIYTVGFFIGTADFDPGPGTFNLTSTGFDSDVFVSKLDSAGNFVWAKAMGGIDLYNEIGVAVDSGGNIYTVGVFTGTADFDPGPGTFNLTSTGSTDVFVSKLDSAGNFVWAKAMGGIDFDNAYEVVMEAGGNVYTVGSFNGTADFDPGPGTFNLTSTGFDDVFVSKLDSAGTFGWAAAMGGTSDDTAYGVALDGSGNIYTVGLFTGTADFDPGPGTFPLTSLGDAAAFISKLDSAGNFVWAKGLGGPGGTAAARDVALDASGNVHTVGFFGGTVDIDPGMGTFPLTSVGNFDIFVSKLNSAGTLVWATGMGGSTYEDAYGVAVDTGGNVLFVGLFALTVDFDPGPGTVELTSEGSADAFISKLDTTVDRYYLVVPTNGTVEGSYGKNSSSLERPPSAFSCLPQSTGSCSP